MKDHDDKKMQCSQCLKEFILRTNYSPTYLEGRRWNTFYCCPYCGNTTNISLSGNEDVTTLELN